MATKTSSLPITSFDEDWGMASDGLPHSVQQMREFLRSKFNSIAGGSGKQDVIPDLAQIRVNAQHGNTAYGWGNHATQGYLKDYTEQDPVFKASEAYKVTADMIAVLGKLSVDANGNLKIDTNAYSTGSISAYGYEHSEEMFGKSYFRDLLDVQSMSFGSADSGKTVVWNGSAWVKGLAGGNAPTKAELITTLDGYYALAGHSHSQYLTYSDSISNADYADTAGSASTAGSATTAGTASTASRLASTVQLWGRDFNGSSSVSGYMDNVGDITHQTMNNRKAAIHFDNNAWWIGIVKGTTTHQPIICYDNAENGTKDAVYMYGLTSLEMGNVGVGTNDPKEKLHVNGNLRIGNAILSYQNGALVLTDSSGNPVHFAASGGVSAYGISGGMISSLSTLNLTDWIKVGNKVQIGDGGAMITENDGDLCLNSDNCFVDCDGVINLSNDAGLSCSSGTYVSLYNGAAMSVFSGASMSVNSGATLNLFNAKITGMQFTDSTHLRITFQYSGTTYTKTITLT